MPAFELVSDFTPTGDQPQAIEELSRGLVEGQRDQVLLGVTGSGKTFTIAQVVQRMQKPTLVLAHNKTLAAQLYQEFKRLFPKNAACAGFLPCAGSSKTLSTDRRRSLPMRPRCGGVFFVWHGLFDIFRRFAD